MSSVGEHAIRRAVTSDHPTLLAVWRSAVEASHTFLTADDVDWYEQLVAGYIPQMRDLRVAVDVDGRIAGFIAQNDGDIHMLFVDADRRGQGVGTLLLERIGAEFEVLRVDVNEQNPSARRFYERRGFAPVGRSELDGQGRPFPLLHLQRTRGAAIRGR